ncbi:hypothetical protein V496_05336, partial [Pseudogymnoascus sp. VKM F-4515 (FW-2607)]
PFFVRRTAQDTPKSLDRLDRRLTLGKSRHQLCRGSRRGPTVASSIPLLTFRGRRRGLVVAAIHSLSSKVGLPRRIHYMRKGNYN